MITPFSHIFFVVIAAAGMLAYDWRKLRDTRTVVAYLILYVGGFTVSFMVVINPNLPGPTQALRPLLRPLYKLLLKH